MKVHLVDGTYELFRAFYGAPGSLHEGREVGATRALARSLLFLLAEPGVTHVAVAFDTVIESFRNDLFAGYKTGLGIDPALKSQFPLAEDAAEALGLVVWRMIDFEADDAMASFAHRVTSDPKLAGGEQVEQVVLCSPDKDLCQMVQGDRVVLYDRMRKKVLDEDAVKEKFGIGPAAIPDYLALVGDTADGIPGVPKWGAKSAAQVLARYGSVEAIPDDETAWDIKVRGAKSLAESLRAHRDVVPLYKTLATLRCDVPLTETLDDLAWRGAHRGKVDALMSVLGDADLARRIPRWSS